LSGIITYPRKDETETQDMYREKYIVHLSSEESKGEDPEDIKADKGNETPCILRVTDRSGESASQRPFIN